MDTFQATEATPEAKELELLMVLIKDYDCKHYLLPQLNSLEAIKYKIQLKTVSLQKYNLLINHILTT
jgi:HTH-type transcriptional regulator/antitoxin HigA